MTIHRAGEAVRENADKAGPAAGHGGESVSPLLDAVIGACTEQGILFQKALLMVILSLQGGKLISRDTKYCTFTVSQVMHMYFHLTQSYWVSFDLFHLPVEETGSESLDDFHALLLLEVKAGLDAGLWDPIVSITYSLGLARSLPQQGLQ